MKALFNLAFFLLTLTSLISTGTAAPLSVAPTIVTSSDTIDANYEVSRYSADGGSITMSLPTFGSQDEGLVYIFKRTDGNILTSVTIDGGETILDGAINRILGPYEAIMGVVMDSEYVIISANVLGIL